MIEINERFIVDAKGNRISVILDIDPYQRLLEALEDLVTIVASHSHSSNHVIE